MNIEGKLVTHGRLDIAIHQQWPSLGSRTQIKNLICDKKVKLDGTIINRPSYMVKGMVNIEIDFPPINKSVSDSQVNIDHGNIPIVFEDKYLVVLHKPAGITVHPGINTGKDTLVHFLLSQFSRLSNIYHQDAELIPENRPGIIHRLDRDTEGLLIVAKENDAHLNIVEQFQQRTVYKEYHAWLRGNLPMPQKIISGYMQRHPKNYRKMLFSYKQLSEKSREARLSYTVIKKVSDHSLVKIQLHTGRTHQIRATFANLSAPIVHDNLYGWHRKHYSKDLPHGHLLLVANRIQFKHPYSRENMQFHIDLPQKFVDFEKFIQPPQ